MAKEKYEGLERSIKVAEAKVALLNEAVLTQVQKKY